MRVARFLGPVLVFVLALRLEAAPPARTVSLTVETFPPARVYLETPEGLSFLSDSGQPFDFVPPVLRDPRGVPTAYSSGTLVLKAERHGDLRVPVSAAEWANGRLPQVGSYRLPAESFLVAAGDWLKVYPEWVLSGLALAVGALVSAVGWRRQARQKTEQLRDLSSQLETSGDPLLGKLLGNYRVVGRLGQGGMGSVYRVRDDVGEYAAKVIYFDNLDTQSVDRFRREFKLLSQLSHSTFPRCFDYQEKEEMAFQIMELVKGRTLRQSMRAEGLPWSVARPWVLAILEGLECAHQQGIVHRDLKPENIMVDGESVKILDFGIARQQQVTAITMTGQAFGTPQYIAPEQLSGSASQVDLRTDLYSLGVILYELLAGHPPFQSEDVQELFAMHLSSPAPRLTKPGVSSEIAGIIEVLLAKNPANRYSGAASVKEALSAVAATENTQSLGGNGDSGTIAISRRPSSKKSRARDSSEGDRS